MLSCWERVLYIYRRKNKKRFALIFLFIYLDSVRLSDWSLRYAKSQEKREREPFFLFDDAYRFFFFSLFGEQVNQRAITHSADGATDFLKATVSLSDRSDESDSHTHTHILDKKDFCRTSFLSLSAHRGVDSCVTQRMEISLIGIGGDKNDVGCRLQELLLPLFRQLVFIFSFFRIFFPSNLAVECFLLGLLRLSTELLLLYRQHVENTQAPVNNVLGPLLSSRKWILSLPAAASEQQPDY